MRDHAIATGIWASDIIAEAPQQFSHSGRQYKKSIFPGGCSATTPDVDLLNANLPGSGSRDLIGKHERVQCRSGTGAVQAVDMSTMHASRESRFEGFKTDKALLQSDDRDTQAEEDRMGLSCCYKYSIGRGRDRVYG